MRINTIKPAPGSKRPRLRVGRGASAGQGKTCGRGVKGQRARKGGYHKVGFEGGQSPMQRRLPKIGFVSQTPNKAGEVRVHELARFAGKTADLAALKAEHLVNKRVELARVIASGTLDKAVTVGGPGIKVTAGARKIIEAAGGKVVE